MAEMNRPGRPSESESSPFPLGRRTRIPEPGHEHQARHVGRRRPVGLHRLPQARPREEEKGNDKKNGQVEQSRVRQDSPEPRHHHETDEHQHKRRNDPELSEQVVSQVLGARPRVGTEAVAELIRVGNPLVAGVPSTFGANTNADAQSAPQGSPSPQPTPLPLVEHDEGRHREMEQHEGVLR